MCTRSILCAAFIDINICSCDSFFCKSHNYAACHQNLHLFCFLSNILIVFFFLAESKKIIKTPNSCLTLKYQVLHQFNYFFYTHQFWFSGSECVFVSACFPYQCTSWTGVAILTGPDPGMDASTALCAALGPRGPRRPKNGLRTWYALIAEPVVKTVVGGVQFAECGWKLQNVTGKFQLVSIVLNGEVRSTVG